MATKNPKVVPGSTPERKTSLHQFSLLVSAATSSARLAAELGGAERPAAWAAAASEISAELSAFEGKKIEVPRLGYQYRQYNQPAADKLDFNTHPLMAPHKGFEALAKAAETLGDEDVERAAQAVASRLAIAFERDKIPHIAFPQHGKGFKVRTRKDGSREFFEWTSGWHDAARKALPKLSLTPGREPEANWDNMGADEAGSLRALVAQWEPAGAIQIQSPHAAYGDLPLSGTHLGGKLTSTANSESELPRAGSSTPSPGPREQSIDIAGPAAAQSLEPYARRLSWTAIALALGDHLDPADAASPQGSPLARAETAFAIERAYVEKENAPLPPQVFPGAARARRPAICAMQAASTLAAFKAENHHYYGGSHWQGSFGFAGDETTLEARAVVATAVVMTLDAVALKITARAREIATSAEAAWLERNGLGTALELARSVGNGKEASAKAVNWALANPQAAESMRRSKDDPILGLAAKSARYLGAAAPTDEEAISRARAGWAGLGLEAEGFDGVASAPQCSSALLGLAGAELAEKRSDARQALREKTKLAARVLQAAFAEGATESQAIGFLALCQHQEALFLDTRPPSQRGGVSTWLDRLHPDVAPTPVNTAELAGALAVRARARRASHPLAMRAMFRAYAHGEGMDDAFKPERMSGSRAEQTRKWLTHVTTGEDHLPAIDWEKGVEGAWFKDIARRASGPMARAARQAEAEGGRHGALASRSAIALGIRDARDGNDLIGKVREALKEQHGMGDSGWKALGKAPAAMFESLCERLEALTACTLAEMAKAEKARKQSSAQAQAQTGLSFMLLSNAAHFAYDLDTAELVDSISTRRRGSELLRHGIRPITVSSAEQAEFAEREARAKVERLPRIVKSMGERAAKLIADHAKAHPGADAESARKAARGTLENEVALVDDWLRGSEDGVWQTLPTKCSFADLMRRQAAWHEDMAARQVDAAVKGKASPAWGCPLPRAESESWSAVFISSAADLTEEGRAMHHCVSSYSGQCKAGTSRIFSVRLNGERVSTLELRLRGADGSERAYKHQSPQRGETWKLHQNKGSCNAAIVDPSALAFAAEIERKMNEAHLAWCSALEAKRSESATQAAATRKAAQVKLG